MTSTASRVVALRAQTSAQRALNRLYTNASNEGIDAGYVDRLAPLYAALDRLDRLATSYQEREVLDILHRRLTAPKDLRIERLDTVGAIEAAARYLGELDVPDRDKTNDRRLSSRFVNEALNLIPEDMRNITVSGITDSPALRSRLTSEYGKAGIVMHGDGTVGRVYGTFEIYNAFRAYLKSARAPTDAPRPAAAPLPAPPAAAPTPSPNRAPPAPIPPAPRAESEPIPEKRGAVSGFLGNSIPLVGGVLAAPFSWLGL